MTATTPIGPESVKQPILVAGACGMLGQAVVKRFRLLGLEVIDLIQPELDITDPEACRRAMERYRPATVINCAAYTAVDLAESEPEAAQRINVLGAETLALAAARVKAKAVYFSTDFVFDGAAGRPYAETDRPSPQSVYGRTKLAGERAVITVDPNHLILRTAWLYGPHGPNFIRTILAAGRQRGRLEVVDDQIGSPTYTLDLADALPAFLAADAVGVYHLTNSGQASWFDLAAKAVELDGLNVEVAPTTTARINRPAPRPAFSVLNGAKAAGLGIVLRPWTEALTEFLAAYPGGGTGDRITCRPPDGAGR